MKKLALAAAVAAAFATSAHAVDFGQKVEMLKKAQSLSLFGLVGTLEESSTIDMDAAAIDANPAGLLTVAPGLYVKVVSANANLGANIDQMVLWPNDAHPTHIIACNEQGASQIGVQRIDIKTGAVENIIASGLTSCDPARATPWGTIIVGEEAGTNGRIFEILDPLKTTNVVVSGSLASTTISGADAANVAYRGAIGAVSFEGLALLPNGVMYLSDENRPGKGNPGGAIFKFIPNTLWTEGAPAITNLSQSPFASGSLWGMRVGRNSGNTDYGQGNEFGRGVWISVPTSSNEAPTNLRAQAITLKLTSYYRPEDMDIDLAALADGNVRFCGTNTGQDVPADESNGDNHWGEVYCITDGTLAQAATSASIPEYQPLVIGNLDFAMMDNVAYQPGRGNWIINEDGEGPTYSTPRNNDIFACLDDGDDADELSDGCVKVMSINDLSAETTGGVFDATGTRYFVSVQHNDSGHGVILEVDGWLPEHTHHHHHKGWHH
ncbi:MAG TPA: alkaline phosphatase PhoX [Spongiibacteraceae bacterium]|nr:alkaline phosphatase PhoX [Spongiibacteraceae bacterium]